MEMSLTENKNYNANSLFSATQRRRRALLHVIVSRHSSGRNYHFARALISLTAPRSRSSYDHIHTTRTAARTALPPHARTALSRSTATRTPITDTVRRRAHHPHHDTQGRPDSPPSTRQLAWTVNSPRLHVSSLLAPQSHPSRHFEYRHFELHHSQSALRNRRHIHQFISAVCRITPPTCRRCRCPSSPRRPWPSAPHGRPCPRLHAAAP